MEENKTFNYACIGRVVRSCLNWLRVYLFPPKTPDEFYSEIESDVHSYIQSKPHNTENLIRLYSKIDSVLKPTIQREAANQFRSIPCNKGCNSCCKAFCILVSLEEAFAIIEYVNNLPANERTLVIQAIQQSQSTKNQPIRPLPGNERCALLSDEKGCMIYAARPILCRTYYGIEKENCLKWAKCGNGKSPMPLTFNSSLNLDVHKIAWTVQGAYSKNGKNKNMPTFEINDLLRHVFSNPATLNLWLKRSPNLAIAPRLTIKRAAKYNL